MNYKYGNLDSKAKYLINEESLNRIYVPKEPPVYSLKNIKSSLKISAKAIVVRAKYTPDIPNLNVKYPIKIAANEDIAMIIPIASYEDKFHFMIEKMVK